MTRRLVAPDNRRDGDKAGPITRMPVTRAQLAARSSSPRLVHLADRPAAICGAEG